MSDFTIRSAQPEDFERIGTLTADIFVSEGYVSPNSDYKAVLLDAATRARESEFLVGVVDDAVVGTVTYCVHDTPWAQVTDPGEGEFRMLAVSPQVRGRGLGEALVRACIDRSRRDACSALRLSTEPVMHAAHRIYARLGFVRTPERDWSPVPGVDLLTYALTL